MGLEDLLREVRGLRRDISVVGCHAVYVRPEEGLKGIEVRTNRKVIEGAIRDAEAADGIAVVRCRIEDGLYEPGREFMAIVIGGYSSKKVHSALEALRVQICKKGYTVKNVKK